MAKNPILDELHATRERLFAESGGTISGLLDRLRAVQAASKRPTYKLSDKNVMRRRGEATPSEVANLSPPSRISRPFGGK